MTDNASVPAHRALTLRIGDDLVSYDIVKRVSEAQNGYCQTCEGLFSTFYWSFRKAMLNHERGTGHKTVLLRLSAVQPGDMWHD